MKKFLLGLVFVISSTPFTISFAQSTQGKEKPQWVLDHEKNFSQGHHSKKTKPVRNVGGTATWGAKQVSPQPKK
jgi:hypothetical protein